MTEYEQFLEGKIAHSEAFGIKEATVDDINPILKPHQRDMALWMIHGGRRACFAKFGLGKTIIQLEVLNVIKRYTGLKALIILPLGVKQEFSRDAKELLGLTTEYVKNTEEALNSTADICLTNYERVRDGGIDVNVFGIVSLDEASVLRGYGTKTYQSFLQMFPNVPYKFVATATPSPNRYKELIHYAGFLGIMDTGAALTRFFKRDSTKANNLTLYPHKEKEFWLWMASWACFLQRPSDIGYSDEGYDLPDMEVIWHEVISENQETKFERDGQGLLISGDARDLKSAAEEKRFSINERIDKMLEIVNDDPDRHFILWHDQEKERHAIKKAIPETSEVYGSLDLEKREQRIIDFSDGKTKYLATKPILSGSGCNFQRHCADAIFLGVGYKFNDFIQACHRIYRFLQQRKVTIHIIHTNKEREIIQVLKDKWKRHDELTETMSELIKKYGLANNIKAKDEMKRTIGCERKVESGNGWTAINNDCVDETNRMEENSVDLIVTSIPFGNHYEYSLSYNDFGHNLGNDEFFDQMDYLTPNLHKVLKPGRVYACHVKDRILFGNATGKGMPTVDPFHMLTTLHTMKHGFAFMGMITIETDVVRENNQTYRLGWTEQCKDGTKMGVGCPEYLLLFRKLPTDTTKAYADDKVEKSKEDYTRGRWQIDARAKWNSSGNRLLTPEEIQSMRLEDVNKWFSKLYENKVYDFDHHVKTANNLDDVGSLPAKFESLRIPARTKYVWDDVNRMRTLNGEQSRRALNMHICPLQFDIIDRCIDRYSNEGELVFDPFGGIMSVPYRALLKKRKAIATELNPEYWHDGTRYCAIAEQKMSAPSLFDITEIE